MNDEPLPPVPTDYDPLDISKYDKVRQRHIVGLGLIAEFSAQIDETARWLLGLAVGTLDIKQITALFLGDRFGTIERKFKALADLDPTDPFLVEAKTWFMKTGKLVEQRDALIHRPVLGDFVQGRSRHVLLPARRSQEAEELSGQAVNLVAKLENAWEDGYDIAVRKRGQWAGDSAAKAGESGDGDMSA